MNDEVENLINEIRNDPRISQTSFTANFLNDLADVYEKHGAGVTKVYLLEKRGRRDLGVQAEAALRVLEKISNNPRAAIDRRIGRLIFKTLPGIISEETDRRKV